MSLAFEPKRIQKRMEQATTIISQPHTWADLGEALGRLLNVWRGAWGKSIYFSKQKSLLDFSLNTQSYTLFRSAKMMLENETIF